MYYFEEESDLSKRHAYEYALRYAHINQCDMDKKYMKDLSKYDSWGYEAGGYNESVRRAAINLYPGLPQEQADYIREHAYTEEEAWTWDSLDKRNQYSKHYKGIQRNKDYAQAMVGAIILNHLVSGFNSMLSARKANRQLEMGVQIKDDMTPTILATWRF